MPKTQVFDFDTIIIGSGFGGSVMACRLAQKGEQVCVLERGQRYGMNQFPRRVDEFEKGLFHDPDQDHYGLFEFMNHPESSVISVSACGLGGGSLIYASVLMPMPADHFKGWPGGINLKVMQPFYTRALKMLEAQSYPYQGTLKTEAFSEAATKLAQKFDDKNFSEAPELINPKLAVRFKGDFLGQQSLNQQGVVQSSCIGCGECDVGCNIHAKNTLDLNYLALATKSYKSKSSIVQTNTGTESPVTEESTTKEHRAAEIRTRANVTSIEPINNEQGYKVVYEIMPQQLYGPSGFTNKRTKTNPRNQNQKISLTAKRVILAAGSINSTRILLKMKAENKLKNLSERLGYGWCGNGDLEGSVILSNQILAPSEGPVITRALQYKGLPYPDGFTHSMIIQDGGFPWFVEWFLAGKLPSPRTFFSTLSFGLLILWDKVKRFLFQKESNINLGRELSCLIDSSGLIRRSMVLLGMGRDRSTGQISLNKNNQAIIKWDIKESNLHYKRLRSEMKKLAQNLGGTFVENPLSHLNKIIAVHPLGGCNMAENPQEGVVAPNGEVFGHPGLFVVDGSILPTSTGPNPSLTITANAERIASLWKK